MAKQPPDVSAKPVNITNRPAEATKKPTGAVSPRNRRPPTPFHDEPAAHALYKQMIEAMRKAKSLSYVSHYTLGEKGKVSRRLHVPGVAEKAELLSRGSGGLRRRDEEMAKTAGGGRGILIGDGNTLWIYWPEGRSKYEFEDAEGVRENAADLLHEEAGPAGRALHRPRDRLARRRHGMPVIDPSTFHGYTDSLQAYLDGVKSLPAEKVGGEECDKIEVSIMKHQRSWYLWLSKRDHLPRKLKEIVRVSYDLVIDEEWSSVTINADIPDTMFAWKPPKGWTQWRMPPLGRPAC